LKIVVANAVGEVAHVKFVAHLESAFRFLKQRVLWSFNLS